MNQKLRERARKIAAMAAETGPEADAARGLLRRMCDRWPELSYYLEEHATVIGEVEIDIPSPAHRRLLWHLAERFDLEVRFEVLPGPPGAVPMVRSYLMGMQGEVRQVIEEYAPHAATLAVIEAMVGQIYVDRCFAPNPSRSDREFDDDVTDEIEAMEEEGDVSMPPPETQAWQENEEARARQVEALLDEVDQGVLRHLVLGLVNVTAPVREPPRLLVDGNALAWDSPEITWELFVKIHEACCPDSEVDDMTLRTRYDEGMRLYPPTGRFRYVPDLDRLRDAFWSDEDYFAEQRE